MIAYAWRSAFVNTELDELHAEGFGHPPSHEDWWSRVNRHSLGWACARDDGRLVGFVNVAWDGGTHAFVLDTVVAARARRHGVGRELIALAEREATRQGCEWLHVDFEPHLRPFYLDHCGFHETDAGLRPLR